MKILEIQCSNGDSKIYIAESIKNLPEYIDSEKTIILTDSNLRRFYGGIFPECNLIEIGIGEKIKTLETIKNVYQKLMAFEADRSTFLLGIGGGIVCDVAGFSASTYMRGIDFGFVSTSLLSQVDASVGGKNGVNFSGYKNIVGAFKQPRFVICDLDMLKTLPKKELSSGFAEIVKVALIKDSCLFSFLENCYEKVLNLDYDLVEKLVYESVLIKAAIVEMDEHEKCERRELNFGHTFGHAIERTSGILHGEAVSIGMVIAANLSLKRNMLSSTDTERIKNLLENLNLPVSISIDKERLKDAIRKDKKRKDSVINFVLLREIGNAVVEEIEIEELEAEIDDMC